MAKVTKASVDRVKRYLLQQVKTSESKQLISTYKAQQAKQLIQQMNENMNEMQMGEQLRELNKHIRLDIITIYKHAMGEVN